MTLFGGLYALIKTVGGGELGDVYLSVNVKTSKQLAVKMAEKRNMTQARRERLLMEVSILQTLDHPNIVKLHQVIDSEDSIGLVMDYCVGELLQHVISHGR
ncbi:kinase-like protein [Rhizoclosmatium globosum]|uniref:non-specific serine/threonine protein kinase n=1 Tax=Rhizoclosmatium globosum TaxID=329046 RepID=A0A1Y2CZB5_9FUNG|nr:kinase-like protein [Rhizoclosmatium globosum]|eukprot:ORY52373.1 kinase-like protein [Rhizoclosmatium globosum]